MRKNDWDTLIWSLQRQNCILFLGPAIESTGQDRSPEHLTRLLTEELAAEMGETLPPDAELPSVAQRFRDKESRTDLERATQGFYESHAGDRSELLVKLAALPFYLAITSCFDNLLPSAFIEQGKHPRSDFYNFRGPKPENLDMGSVDSPLVYQLYGSVHVPESLVLTDFDLIDFLVSIVPKERLPQSVGAELKKTNKSLLFLGFGIRQWYLRILMHVLRSANSESRSFALETLDSMVPPMDERTVLFFKKGYRIEIFDSDPAAFVQELHDRFFAAPVPAPAINTASPLADMPPPKVFLSYVREDGRFVGQVCEELRKARLDPWMDTSSLEGGDVWRNVIEERLRETDYFLVFQSQALMSRTFSYVHEEIKIARERERTKRHGLRFIIPVRIDDNVEVMPELKDIQPERLPDPSQVASLVSLIVRDYQRRGRQ